MSTPASEVFALTKAKKPRRKRIFPWLGYLTGELMAMGTAGMVPPSTEEILIVRISDGSTVSTYSEGYEPPAVFDSIERDLASMPADQFEREWVN